MVAILSMFQNSMVRVAGGSLSCIEMRGRTRLWEYMHIRMDITIIGSALVHQHLLETRKLAFYHLSTRFTRGCCMLYSSYLHFLETYLLFHHSITTTNNDSTINKQVVVFHPSACFEVDNITIWIIHTLNNVLWSNPWLVWFCWWVWLKIKIMLLLLDCHRNREPTTTEYLYCLLWFPLSSTMAFSKCPSPPNITGPSLAWRIPCIQHSFPNENNITYRSCFVK